MFITIIIPKATPMPKLSKKEITELAEEKYNQQASKMIPYPCDIYMKLIYVPESQIKAAEDDYKVQHLINRGFVVESVSDDDINLKTVYDPEFITKGKRVKEPEVAQSFLHVGDKFKVPTGIIKECIRIEGSDAVFKDLDTMATPVKVPLSIVYEMLRRDAWIKQ